MEITKIFTFEGSHVVRNCTSRRCSRSVHGHSYKVEVTIEGMGLDHAGMLVDFGLLKGPVKELIDSFDHCHVICSYDDPAYVDFFKKYNERWIEVPFNPSAEMLAIMFFHYIEHIFKNTVFSNGEGPFYVKSVTVHETATGRAKATSLDVDRYWGKNYKVKFSGGVMNDWSMEMFNMMSGTYQVLKDKPEQQIVIPGFNDQDVNQLSLFDNKSFD